MSRDEQGGPQSLFGAIQPVNDLDEAVRGQARRRTRRSFLVGVIGAAGLYGAW